MEEDHPESVSRVLNILDCVHADSGYHLGIYIEEPGKGFSVTHRCDQAWFHCYQGDEEPIMRRPYGSHKWDDGNENMCYIRFTFEMFNHLNVDPTPMGAWQTYLLCISKTVLPFSGGLFYTKRQLVFIREHLSKVGSFWSIIEIPELLNLKEDVSPSVTIEGNIATVSCCYWNDWGGLIREYVPITFKENGKVAIGDFKQENLYKYDCGIMF